MLNLIYLIIIVIFIILLRIIRIIPIKPNQRIVVYRLSKFNRINKSGLVILLPFIENFKVIELQEIIPEWQILTTKQLNDKLKEYFSRPDKNRLFFNR